MPRNPGQPICHPKPACLTHRCSLLPHHHRQRLQTRLIVLSNSVVTGSRPGLQRQMGAQQVRNHPVLMHSEPTTMVTQEGRRGGRGGTSCQRHVSWQGAGCRRRTAAQPQHAEQSRCTSASPLLTTARHSAAPHLRLDAPTSAAGKRQSMCQYSVCWRPSYRVLFVRRFSMPGGSMCSCMPRRRAW